MFVAIKTCQVQSCVTIRVLNVHLSKEPFQLKEKEESNLSSELKESFHAVRCSWAFTRRANKQGSSTVGVLRQQVTRLKEYERLTWALTRPVLMLELRVRRSLKTGSDRFLAARWIAVICCPFVKETSAPAAIRTLQVSW